MANRCNTCGTGSPTCCLDHEQIQQFWGFGPEDHRFGMNVPCRGVRQFRHYIKRYFPAKTSHGSSYRMYARDDGDTIGIGGGGWDSLCYDYDLKIYDEEGQVVTYINDCNLTPMQRLNMTNITDVYPQYPAQIHCFTVANVHENIMTLFVSMDYNLDKVVRLMQCFRSLENLFIKVGVSNEKSDMNDSHDEHQLFPKHHGMRLKTVTLEDYEPCDNSIAFSTFFILNAMVLETIKLKFCIVVDFTKGFYKHQQEVLQWYNKASRHAGLILSSSCGHRYLVLEMACIEYLDLTEPFTCEC